MSGTQAPTLSDPNAPPPGAQPPRPVATVDSALSEIRRRRQELKAGTPLSAPPAAVPGPGHNGGPVMEPPAAPAAPADGDYVPGAYSGALPRDPSAAPLPPGAPQPHVAPPGAPPGAELPPDTQVTINVNGQPQRVSLAELQQGYLRQADYTRGSQQAAEAIRRANELGAEFSAARDRLIERLQVVTETAGAEFSKPIDWEAEQKRDPVAYAEKMARYLNWQRQQAELAEAQASRAREEHARKAAVMAQGHRFLSQHIPGWANPATRAAIQADLHAHGLRVGYSAEELATVEVLDPRQILMAFRSMKLAFLEGRRVPTAAAPAPTLPAARNHYRPPAGRVPAATPGGAALPLGNATDAFAARPTVDNALAVLRARRGAR